MIKQITSAYVLLLSNLFLTREMSDKQDPCFPEEFEVLQNSVENVKYLGLSNSTMRMFLSQINFHNLSVISSCW